MAHANGQHVTGVLSEAEEILLRRLWSDGISTVAIGRQMSRSKNSVVGHVHRLGLSGRSSPIPQSAQPREPKARSVGKSPTLPPLASVSEGISMTSLPPDIPKRRADQSPQPRRPASLPKVVLPADDPVKPLPIVTPIPKASAKPRECSWPIGEPRTPDFRYCDAPHTNAGSYCDEHRRMAFEKTPRREARPDGERAATGRGHAP